MKMPPVGTPWPVRAFASAAFDQSEISMPHQDSFPPAEVPAARIVAEVSIDLALVADPIVARSRHHIDGGCQPPINPFSQEPQFTPTADACRLQSTCGNFPYTVLTPQRARSAASPTVSQDSTADRADPEMVSGRLFAAIRTHPIEVLRSSSQESRSHQASLLSYGTRTHQAPPTLGSGRA